jgi:hypothetical protein
MLTLLERNIAAIEHRLVLLTPGNHTPSDEFRNLAVDAARHRQLLNEVQRLRGSVYLRDGAIQPTDLSPEGLHQTTEDERSWHLLLLDAQDRVTSCIWYLEHEPPTSVQSLRVRSCPLTYHESWRERINAALEADLRRARGESIPYAEVGGWAVLDGKRCSSEGLLLILATFGLSRMFGGALGVSTATARHSSAAILRRLGLSRLETDGWAVPPYYDPKYNCEMELLRFDTRRSSPRYNESIEQLKGRLSEVAVVSTGAWATMPHRRFGWHPALAPATGLEHVTPVAVSAA